MVQRVSTVAFEGIEARAVDVQVQVAPGLPAFAIALCQCQGCNVILSAGAGSQSDCAQTGPLPHGPLFWRSLDFKFQTAE
jgi:hypothetical protein